MAWSSRLSLTTILLTLLLVWTVGLRCWYASKDLHVDRFFDEQFNVPNVHAALEEGSLKPVRYAYLRLTYLPQVAVLWILERGVELSDPDFSWFEGEVLKPSGFMLVRTVQVLLGALSVWLTYLVGRRLSVSQVGLLAAFLVAASPTHLVLSTIFKPDILVLATTLLAFLWSLHALERPTVLRYLLAGLGVGLAMSSKPTGGAIALPLALGAVILGFKARRHWLGLLCAGVTSVLVFLILNPYPRYLAAFALQRKRYLAVAAQKGTLGDPLETFRHVTATLFKGAHGRWIGLAAIAGLLLVAYYLWRPRRPGCSRLAAGLWLSFAVGFPLLYSLVTQNVLPQNLLPVLPFTSMAAALLLVTLWNEVRRRWPWVGRQPLAAALATGFVLLVAQRPQAHAYGILVPTTRDRAIELLASDLLRGSKRWIRWEVEGSSPAARPREPGRVRRPPPLLVFWNTPYLKDVDLRVLERSDVEVFPLARTRGPDRDFYRLRMVPEGRRKVHIVEAAPFRAWGPDLVLVLHPWPARETRSVELQKPPENGWFEHPLSASAQTRELAAVEFRLPRVRGAKRTVPDLRVAGRRVELTSLAAHRQVTWVSDRFPLAQGKSVTLRIRLPQAKGADSLRISVRRWATVQ